MVIAAARTQIDRRDRSWRVARRFAQSAAVAVLAVFTATSAASAQTRYAELDTRYAEFVRPFLQTYCLECHGSEMPEAKLDLSGFTSIETVVTGFGTWEHVLQRLEDREMPPPQAGAQPADEQRQQVVEWIRGLRRFEAERNAGDPGLVLARRLSNAELNNTIRDLTGIDIQPAREFPVDPANAAGFDNTGESLSVTPALFTKYLDAARLVAEHIVFKPQGFDFAPFRVVTDTDRDRYAVNRIIEFYERQPTDLADYFQAAWRYREREALGAPNATLPEIAAQDGVSAKYLATVWELLETDAAVGPIARLQAQWQALPAAGNDVTATTVRDACEEIRDFVVTLRAKLVTEFDNPRFRGLNDGSQPLVMRLNRLYARNRRSLNVSALYPLRDGQTPPIPVDPDLIIPGDFDGWAAHEAAFGQFASVFPDAFVVSERGRIFIRNRNPRDIAQESGRLLSAGFHSMMGFFRDDAPLYDMILDEAGQQELDELWRELDFITLAPRRQHAGFIWFERAEPPDFLVSAEFNGVRAEDKDATSEAKLRELAELFLAKVRSQNPDPAIVTAVELHFEQTSASNRRLDQDLLAAQPLHLTALLEFAEQAWRRTLSTSERDDLIAFYHSLRTDTELSHEDAIRDVVVSVLASPLFWYRIDLVDDGGDAVQPLSGDALASRLSYFLWSSLPDEELRAHAAAGDLQQPEVLLAQVQRMLRDDRIRGLATEFGANWLDIRRFEEHNSVDRGRFPQFTNELRQAMFEEPIRFLTDAFQHDRTAADLLYAEHTFVNPVLARHYGLPEPAGGPDDWVRVDDASTVDRGGLLPMSVFLTRNAPGLRTSPVKRGYWVVRRLLGTEIPPPPPNVPEIPADETQLGDLTLAETLAQHRANPSCATCHDKFDSFGLVFEGFGPVGERRDLDLAGRPVETIAQFPDGSTGRGLEGLRTYLQEQRQDDFLDHLTRQLLAYALGRTLIPSDDATIRAMREQLTAHDGRLSSLVEVIVTSPQFLNKRVRNSLTADRSP